MVKAIDDLKKIIQNGYVLKNHNKEIKISRSANNILRMHGRLTNWTDLQNIIANGDWDLEDGKGNKIVDTKKSGWGGARIPGPGKKIGAPKKDPSQKKKPCSFSMSDATRDRLDELCQVHDKKRSEILELLILGKL